MATIKELIPIDATSISGEDITQLQASYLANFTGVAAGAVVANAVVVAGAAKNVDGINNLTCTGVITAGNGEGFSDGTATLVDGLLAGATLGSGTVLASPELNGSITGNAIESAVSTSGDKVSSSGAIKDYVDDRHYVSDATTYTGAGQTITKAHTLGVIPNAVQAYAKCIGTTKDIGYAINNIIPITPVARLFISGVIDADYGMSIRTGITNVGGTIADEGIAVINHANGEVTTLGTSSDWEIYFIVSKY